MLIDVKENETGFLLPVTFNQLPYSPKRIFVIKNKFSGAIRGKHAHLIDKQILLVLNGSIKLSYENKFSKGILNLSFGQTYFSKELEWLEIEMLEPNTIILVFCSIEYDETEYIRDYDLFKKKVEQYGI